MAAKEGSEKARCEELREGLCVSASVCTVVNASSLRLVRRNRANQHMQQRV